jgi:hypothetical protein
MQPGILHAYYIEAICDCNESIYVNNVFILVPHKNIRGVGLAI